eukprot:5164770-Prymnesium_polylepis.2
MERRGHVGWPERGARVGCRITELRDAISTHPSVTAQGQSEAETAQLAILWISDLAEVHGHHMVAASTCLQPCPGSAAGLATNEPLRSTPRPTAGADSDSAGRSTSPYLQLHQVKQTLLFRAFTDVMTMVLLNRSRGNYVRRCAIYSLSGEPVCDESLVAK